MHKILRRKRNTHDYKYDFIVFFSSIVSISHTQWWCHCQFNVRRCKWQHVSVYVRQWLQTTCSCPIYHVYFDTWFTCRHSLGWPTMGYSRSMQRYLPLQICFYINFINLFHYLRPNSICVSGLVVLSHKHYLYCIFYIALAISYILLVGWFLMTFIFICVI